MHNIGPIIAFALHNKGFGPDHFFWRTKFHWEAENFTGRCVFEPEVVNFTETVSRVEDNINKIILAINFPQPVRKGKFRFESRFTESLKGFVEIAPLDE